MHGSSSRVPPGWASKQERGGNAEHPPLRCPPESLILRAPDPRRHQLWISDPSICHPPCSQAELSLRGQPGRVTHSPEPVQGGSLLSRWGTKPAAGPRVFPEPGPTSHRHHPTSQLLCFPSSLSVLPYLWCSHFSWVYAAFPM